MKLNRNRLVFPLQLETRLPRILFDQDDVLFDLLSSIVESVNKLKGTNFSVEDVTSWDMLDSLGPEAYDVLKRENYFAELKPKGNAVEVFRRMYEGGRYDCRIVTAAIPETVPGKVESLKRHMPFFNLDHFITCSDKSSVWGDVLIDDGICNLNSFRKIGGHCILFDMPHNRKSNDFIRVKDIEEAEWILDKMFYPETMPAYHPIALYA